LKAEKENAAKTEAALLEKQKLEQEEMAAREEQLIQQKKKSLEEINAKQKKLSKEQEYINSLFDKSKNIVDLTGKSIEQISQEVNKQVESYENAKDALDDSKNAVKDLKGELTQAQTRAAALEKAMAGVATKANNAAAALRSAANEKARLNSTGGGGGGGGKGKLTGGAAGMMSNNGVRAAGGPVMGGGRYTVNELGVEGFMSASGRMSEIKAPSWGEWRAPGAGTVIPAHVWASIKAQGGQKASGGMPKAAGGTGGMIAQMRAMGASGRSDVVTNNVTIQSDNVDRTVQQSLVSLRRVKRARYY
jgi:hypothetical protein